MALRLIQRIGEVAHSAARLLLECAEQLDSVASPQQTSSLLAIPDLDPPVLALEGAAVTTDECRHESANLEYDRFRRVQSGNARAWTRHFEG